MAQSSETRRGGRGLSGRLLATLVVLAVTACVLGGVATQRSAASADPAALFSNGAVAIAGPHTLTLGMQGILPGDGVSGSATVANTGHATGRFSLGLGKLTDRPGPDGGSLARTLRLVVVDVTGGAARTVYAGPIGDLPSVDLGLFRPGQQHSYRFTVSFPSAAAAHYDFTGSALAVAFTWTAVTTG
jgi:hypothetical protein